MNGKAAKRIRIAADVLGTGKLAWKVREIYKRLKEEYKRLPYHHRATPKRGHSAMLKRFHNFKGGSV